MCLFFKHFTRWFISFYPFKITIFNQHFICLFFNVSLLFSPSTLLLKLRSFVVSDEISTERYFKIPHFSFTFILFHFILFICLFISFLFICYILLFCFSFFSPILVHEVLVVQPKGNFVQESSITTLICPYKYTANHWCRGLRHFPAEAQNSTQTPSKNGRCQI